MLSAQGRRSAGAKGVPHRYVTSSCRPDWWGKHGAARHQVATGKDGAVVWCMQGGSVPGAPALIRPEPLLIGLKLLRLPIWTCTPRSTSTTVLRTFPFFEKVETAQDSRRLSLTTANVPASCDPRLHHVQRRNSEKKGSLGSGVGVAGAAICRHTR